jgi:hypothetical protein
VVRFLVGEAGIRQIIDIGTGILTDAEDPAGEPSPGTVPHSCRRNDARYRPASKIFIGRTTGGPRPVPLRGPVAFDADTRPEGSSPGPRQHEARRQDFEATQRLIRRSSDSSHVAVPPAQQEVKM